MKFKNSWKLLLTPVCLFLANCDGIAGRKLQCHDQDVQALVSETLFTGALDEAATENDDASLDDLIASFPANHPLTFEGTIERARSDSGGITCRSTVILDTSDSRLKPRMITELVTNQLSTLQQFGRFAAARSKADRLNAVLEYQPRESGDTATWAIEYAVNFTSDGKQFVVSTEKAGGVSLWLGYYLAGRAVIDRELSLGATKADDYEADSLHPDDAPQESPPAPVN